MFFNYSVEIRAEFQDIKSVSPLNSITADGGTCFMPAFSSISNVINKNKNIPYTHIILFLTDG